MMVALEDQLCLWVVFDRPRDFPDHIVVRRQFVMRNEQILHAPVGGLYDDIHAARQDIPFGAACLMRDPDDDPAIVETWF